MPATLTQIAWAAGVIDGEGCISLTRRSPQAHNGAINPNYRLVLKVTMCDSRTIRTLHRLFGRGTLQKQKQLHAYWSQPWIWFCNATDAEEVLKLIRPYSVTKKREVDTALEFLAKTDRSRAGKARSLTPSEIALRERYFIKLRDLKTSNQSKVKKKEHEAKIHREKVSA